MIVASTKVRVARWEDWTGERMAEEAGRQCELRGEEAERLRAMVPGLDVEAARQAFLVKVGQRRGVAYYALHGLALGRYARGGALPGGLRGQGDDLFD